MKIPKYLIGVDGGGTVTNALLCDIDGTVRADAHSRGSNIRSEGVEESTFVVYHLLNELCRGGNVQWSDIAIVVVGIAGGGSERIRKRFKERLEQSWEGEGDKPEELLVVSDGDIALESAFGDAPGVVLIAGTGSLVYGRDTDGSVKKIGGWGHIIGDPGSGRNVGTEVIRLFARYLDGCSANPSITESGESGSGFIGSLIEKIGSRTIEGLKEKIYGDNYPVQNIIPDLMKAADDGDEDALNIVNQAADELVSLLGCGLRKFSFKNNIPLALKGGMVENGSIYFRIIMERINTEFTNVDVITDTSSSCEGAIAIGRRLLNI